MMDAWAGWADGLSPPDRLSREAFLLGNVPPREIGLGTAVRFCRTGGHARASMTDEGVVIEVVPPGRPVLSRRVMPYRAARSTVIRYVVQCWTCRVLRRAAEMVLVSL